MCVGPVETSSPSVPAGRSSPVSGSTVLYTHRSPEPGMPAAPASLGRPTVDAWDSSGSSGRVSVIAPPHSVIP